MELKVMSLIEEQVALMFTGKVNILANFNRQFLGHILFKNGEMIQVSFENHLGLKAFYHLVLQEAALQSYEYVVEPELIDENNRQIHYSFGVIKNRMNDILKLHQSSLKFRPPHHVKILPDAEFLEDTLPVSPEEFEVLKTLTNWNDPFNIYQHCPLLDHEITMALVSLRKKGALKIIAPRQEL